MIKRIPTWGRNGELTEKATGRRTSCTPILRTETDMVWVCKRAGVLVSQSLRELGRFGNITNKAEYVKKL